MHQARDPPLGHPAVQRWLEHFDGPHGNCATSQIRSYLWGITSVSGAFSVPYSASNNSSSASTPPVVLLRPRPVCFCRAFHLVKLFFRVCSLLLICLRVNGRPPSSLNLRSTFCHPYVVNPVLFQFNWVSFSSIQSSRSKEVLAGSHFIC